jgi:hypothetical protein
MRRRGSGLLRLALGGAAVFGGPSEALASPLFELAGDTVGQGGLAARVLGLDASAAYFNPALLVEADSGLSLGVFVLSEQIGITLDGRLSHAYDVPDGVANAQPPGGGAYPRTPIPTSWLENGRPGDPALPARPRQAAGSGHDTFGYQAIGLVHRLFDGALVLGLHALVPYSSFTGAGAFYNDEREQYFTNSLHPELYSDRMTATSLAFGGGVRLSEQLSLGLSFTLSLQTTADTPTFVTDAGHLDQILVDSKVSVYAKVSPHFGASYRPDRRWRIVATVHSPEKLEIDTGFTFLLANGLAQSAKVSFTHAYMPWEVALGVAHDLLEDQDQALTLALVGMYARWSEYVDRHSEQPVPEYAWYDTLSPTFAIRYRGPLVASLDLAYVPSPVPDQTGRSNYVDNDRIDLRAGAELAFLAFGAGWRIGASAEVHRLIPRSTTKLMPPGSADKTPWLVVDEVPDDAVVGGQPLSGRAGLQTNNPGWPGFRSEGWVLGGGVYLGVVP